MKIVSFISTKGGSGKSTICQSVAVAMAQDRRILVLDCDPQGSTADWYIARPDQDSLKLARLDAVSLPDTLPSLEGYDVVLIDTAGRGSPTTKIEAQSADLVLVPVQPTQMDVRAADTTKNTVKESGSPFAFVLSQTHHTAGRAKQVESVLAMLGPVAPVRVVRRATYQDASAVNQGVTEYEPQGKAADEIRSLVAWIDNQLGA